MRYFQQWQEWCLGFVFDPGFTSVVLIQKNNKLHVGKWNGLGGELEKGETPLKAMEREYAEEANGYAIKDWVLAGFLDDPNGAWKVHVFAGIDTDCVDTTEVQQLISNGADSPSPVLLSEVELLPLAPYVMPLIQLCISKLKNPGTPLFSLQNSLLITDSKIKEVVTDGRDYYKAGAAHVLGIPESEVTREQRYRFKEMVMFIWIHRIPEAIFDILDQRRSEILGTPRKEIGV